MNERTFRWSMVQQLDTVLEGFIVLSVVLEKLELTQDETGVQFRLMMDTIPKLISEGFITSGIADETYLLTPKGYRLKQSSSYDSFERVEHLFY